MLIEALILMGTVRLAILLLPFHRLAYFMGGYMEESVHQVSETEQYTINKVKWAVTLAILHAPWKGKCLVAALSAQTMLKKRGIDSTLYLGIARDKNSNLIAHAWLRSGQDIITGGFEHRWFTAVARFAISHR